MLAAASPAIADDVQRLVRAIDSGSAATVEEIVRQGADPNAQIVTRDRSRGAATTPLLVHAVRRGCLDCARSLLDGGANVLARTAPDGDSAMHAAAAHASPESFEMLARYGADPNAQNARALTPLHVAARGASPATLAAVLARGADPNATSADGTPLMVAVRANRDGTHVSHIRMLIGAKADPNIPDRTEHPLHAAVANPQGESYERVIAGLVRAGARTDVRNARGETPAELAARLSRTHILKHLVPQP